jgi:hypothetical protein
MSQYVATGISFDSVIADANKVIDTFKQAKDAVKGSGSGSGVDVPPGYMTPAREPSFWASYKVPIILGGVGVLAFMFMKRLRRNPSCPKCKKFKYFCTCPKRR